MYGGEESYIEGFGGKPEGKRPLGRPRCSGRIILRWIFRKWDGGAWTGLIWLRKGTGTCKHSNETLGSIKRGEFLD
jgi:hypothetical protein